MAGILALAVACAAPAPDLQPTLYQRLGGEPVLRRVVEAVVDRTATDPRTRRSFEGVNLARVKDRLYDYSCARTGGGCHYLGDPMDRVHQGMEITEAELSLQVAFLREALDAAGVGLAEKNELLRLLAPLKRDIVTK